MRPCLGNPSRSELREWASPADITLVAFYALSPQRYSLYWDIFTAEEWEKHQAAAVRLPSPDYHPQPSDPEWLAQVVQFHGHLGPSVVAGARMGMIGLRAVDAKGYFDVEVTCKGPLAQPPQSCFLDGVQVATGATTGKRTLNWTQADNLVVRVKNTQTGKTAELRPTPALMDMLASFKVQPKAVTRHGPGQQDHDRLEATARKIVAMSASEIAHVTIVFASTSATPGTAAGPFVEPQQSLCQDSMAAGHPANDTLTSSSGVRTIELQTYRKKRDVADDAEPRRPGTSR